MPRSNKSLPQLYLFFLFAFALPVVSEPIVITGASTPSLLGKSIDNIRIINGRGKPIPFQIDELTPEGEYVCFRGDSPNNDESNGILDSIDEIVFLRKDCSPIEMFQNPAITQNSTAVFEKIEIGTGEGTKIAYISNDTSITLSPYSYIQYDPVKQKIRTPWYYAVFGKDRFHFTHAGVKEKGTPGYIDLTRELRLKIYLNALWGLLSIQYNEESLVCKVKRYKIGPIRLIRRGDLYLKLGLILKANSAAVNQICYPQMVRVPVYVHLPVRFKSFLREAYIEMTPVISEKGKEYDFTIPEKNITFPLTENTPLDTLIPVMPNNSYFSVTNGLSGYGWLVNSDMQNRYLDGSGFLISSPSDRGGIAHCGFRLNVHDMPRGYYLITNWVLFSNRGKSGFVSLRNSLNSLTRISTETATVPNAVKIVHVGHK
ncbi:MAG: hypothetical protein GF401_10595 [Chitinivibrionales bacterium]|nr:hypothetical protein [Chitinivibrionales bacterium]